MLQHAAKESIICSDGGFFVAAIDCFPFHKTAFIRRYGTCLRVGHITDNAETVVPKKFRDDLHIIAKLKVGIGCTHIFTRATFKLYNDQR